MAALSPRAPFAWLLVPLLSGYIAAGFLPSAPLLLAMTGAAMAAAAAPLAWTRGTGATAAWAGLTFCGAAFLAAAFYQHRTQPPAEWDNLPPREAVLDLRVDRVFNSSGASPRAHGIAMVTGTEPHLDDLVGRKVYFSKTPPPETSSWSRGTRLQGSGLLERLEPEGTGAKSFQKYLAQAGAQFRFTRISMMGEPSPPTGFFGFCSRQHDRIEGFLRRSSIERAAIVDIYVAMLLGKRSALTPDQVESFLTTGTLHLFAISGLHIGVIALALHQFLALCRIPAKPAALIGLSLLVCFVGITGASPSAVRAFLMVLFFWGARFVNRAPNPVAALAASALLVLLLFPNQLFNPGFQLSYAVVAGILFLGLPLGDHLQEKWRPFRGLPETSLRRPHKFAIGCVRWTALTIGISLSATLLSSPLSIHYFGTFAPGAAIFNLVLIPAASLVIVAGFVCVLLSMAGLGALGAIFNHAGWLVIALMEQVVAAAPSIPGLFWHASFLSPWLGPATVAAVVGTLMVCSYGKWRAPRFHFVLPFAVFVLLLVSAARLTFIPL